MPIVSVGTMGISDNVEGNWHRRWREDGKGCVSVFARNAGEKSEVRSMFSIDASEVNVVSIELSVAFWRAAGSKGGFEGKAGLIRSVV